MQRLLFFWQHIQLPYAPLLLKRRYHDSWRVAQVVFACSGQLSRWSFEGHRQQAGGRHPHGIVGRLGQPGARCVLLIPAFGHDTSMARRHCPAPPGGCTIWHWCTPACCSTATMRFSVGRHQVTTAARVWIVHGGHAAPTRKLQKQGDPTGLVAPRLGNPGSLSTGEVAVVGGPDGHAKPKWVFEDMLCARGGVGLAHIGICAQPHDWHTRGHRLTGKAPEVELILYCLVCCWGGVRGLYLMVTRLGVLSSFRLGCGPQLSCHIEWCA